MRKLVHYCLDEDRNGQASIVQKQHIGLLIFSCCNGKIYEYFVILHFHSQTRNIKEE